MKMEGVVNNLEFFLLKELGRIERRREWKDYMIQP